MKIKILESAKEDLKEGFHFYEFQERGSSESLHLSANTRQVEIPHNKTGHIN
jgi:hypothetical protein